MKKALVAVAIGVLAMNVVALAGNNGGKKKSIKNDGPENSISDVMKAANTKKGLFPKVKAGTATDEEKLELLDLYIDMFENEPPKGDQGEWMQQAGAVTLVRL